MKMHIHISILLLILCTATAAQESIMQRRMYIDSHKSTIFQALNEIEESIGYSFIYSSDEIDNNRRTNILAKGEQLSEVLNRLLQPQTFDYKIIDNHILIAPSRNDTTKGTEPVDTTFISGRIIDAQSLKPIQYVSIGISGTTYSTISNGEGCFKINLPNDTITTIDIAHIGYKRTSIPIKLANQTPIDVLLQPNVISIQEVIIRRADAAEIVRQAVKKNAQNKYDSPTTLTSFYREGVKKDGKTLTYNEAVIDIYKPNVTGRQTSVKTIKARGISNINSIDTLVLKLKGGLSASISLDIVQSCPDFLTDTEIYTYTISDYITHNGLSAYVIDFEPKPYSDAIYKGTLYIETNKLAILHSDFEINSMDIGKADLLIIRKSRTHKLTPIRFAYKVDYRQCNNKLYVNYTRCDIRIKARRLHHIFRNTFDAFIETATCHVDTVNVQRPPRRETTKKETIFSNEKFKYDPEFWEQYSTIEPEREIKEIINDNIISSNL